MQNGPAAPVILHAAGAVALSADDAVLHLPVILHSRVELVLAAGLQESKVYLSAESEGMALKYKLDFDRAWATVGAALEDAKVTVEDLDRSAAIYYVYYSSRHNPNPGFFSRVFGGGDDKDDSGVGHRFIVQLRPEGKEVSVTVGTTGELASLNTDSLILKERLLKLIKEYST